MTLRKCLAGTKLPVDLERATSRIWSYALQAERKAVMYEVMPVGLLGRGIYIYIYPIGSMYGIFNYITG